MHKLKELKILYSPQKSEISGNSENNVFRVFRKNRRFFRKKAVSNLTIISVIVIVVITVIFLMLTSSFSKRIEKTDESAVVNRCKLPGTNNYCCEPYSGGEITPKEGGWADCEEPESSCCVG